MESSRFVVFFLLGVLCILVEIVFLLVELSDWAESRGLKCKGCAEKADWVDLVWNNKDVPEKEAPKVEEEPASDAEKDAQFAEIEKMLEKAGVKGKAFNRKEMEKMLKNIKKDPEQEGKKEEEKKDEL